MSERAFSTLLTAAFSTMLIFASLFLNLGIGMHSHNRDLGLFDSFGPYMVIYAFLTTALSLTFFNARYLGSLGGSYGAVVLYLTGIMLAVGFRWIYRILMACITETTAISTAYYIWLLTPMSVLGIMFVIMAKAQYQDYLDSKI